MQEEVNTPELSNEEKVVVNYYLALPKSATSRLSSYDGILLLIATGCFGAGAWKGDMSLALVGFMLLWFRSLQTVFGNAEYARMFHSIFTKYEAKVKRLVQRHNEE